MNNKPFVGVSFFLPFIVVRAPSGHQLPSAAPPHHRGRIIREQKRKDVQLLSGQVVGVSCSCGLCVHMVPVVCCWPGGLSMGSIGLGCVRGCVHFSRIDILVWNVFWDPDSGFIDLGCVPSVGCVRSLQAGIGDCGCVSAGTAVHTHRGCC